VKGRRLTRSQREFHQSVAVQRYMAMLSEFSWKMIDPMDQTYADDEVKMAIMAFRQADRFMEIGQRWGGSPRKKAKRRKRR